ncbi:MAG TPA: GTP-binding protein [Trichormus sp. M33_DOE_039]|nr:GTP-binding protein [Trichormus sp. M33_DOE_039]
METKDEFLPEFIQSFPKTSLPIIIVTGCLGSGKSSFINEILKNLAQKNLKTGVIVAEFGKVAILSDIVYRYQHHQSSHNYTISDALLEQVYKVLGRKEKIDYLIVETHGFSDILEIMLTFMSTKLRDLTRLVSVINVVNAANYSLDLFKSDSALKQITYSDVILLNKTDLVDEATLIKLERKINEVNNSARIVRTQRSQAPLPLILDVDWFDDDTVFNLDDGFTSVFFQSDKPFSIRKFQYFLDNQLPNNVFRAKGIMWFDESPKKHIFYFCGNRLTFDNDEWKDHPKNQLLLIGRNLDRQTLLLQLENCLC